MYVNRKGGSSHNVIKYFLICAYKRYSPRSSYWKDMGFRIIIKK